MLDEQWMVQFLERVRADNSEQGIHVLYRILPGSTPKWDTVTLPVRGTRDPLIGLSHVPTATVVYARYRPAKPAVNFLAFVFWPDGSHCALFGEVASESGCKSTGRFAASWVSIRAGELK